MQQQMGLRAVREGMQMFSNAATVAVTLLNPLYIMVTTATIGSQCKQRKDFKRSHTALDFFDSRIIIVYDL